MARSSLIIAGVEIPIISRLDCDVKFDSIGGGSSSRRRANGDLFSLTRWRKHRISISASGWAPAPLLAIDYDNPFVIELPYPVVLLPGQLLPAGWSSRAAPWDERSKPDQAGHTVRYVFVKMTVKGDPPSQSNGSSVDPSWDFVCETV